MAELNSSIVYGNLNVNNNLTIKGLTTLASANLIDLTSTGNVLITGNLTINTNKFSVDSATGNTTIAGTVTWLNGSSANANAAYTHSQDNTGSVHGATNINTGNMIVKRDSSGNFFAGTITASLSGNASTATTLQTTRTIALSGDVSGSGTFNGGENLTITTTVADDSHNHIISNVDGLQTALDSKSPTHTHPYASDSHPTVVASTVLGHVKSGTDITIDASGNVSVNDDSHNHIISNIDELQTALDSKAPTHTHPYRADTWTPVTQTITDSVTTTSPSENAVYDALALKANLASPALSGTPTAPTAVVGTNSTQIATTAYVKNQAYLTGNQNISITGDVSGSGTTAITLTLANSGVTEGTYSKVTVDAKGRVTGGEQLVSGDLPTVPNTQISGLGTASTKNVGTSSGQVPILDANGKLETTILPAIAITDTFVVANQTAMLALTAQTGDVAIRTDLNKSYILRGVSASTLADWQELSTPTDSVQSVNGKIGVVSLTYTDVGAAPAHTHPYRSDTWTPVYDGIRDSQTGTSPSENAVYDALAGKAAVHSHPYLSNTGGTLDGGTNTTLTLLSDDSGVSKLELIGDSQGTGIVYVGQSTTYGGGIFYNGDGNPTFASGEASDRIGLFRRTSGVDTVVLDFSHDSNIINFKSTPTVNGTAVSLTHTHPYAPDSHPSVVATTTLGHVKSGTDITVDTNGNVSVNDDSHNHIISNIDNLQTTLDNKTPFSTLSATTAATTQWYRIATSAVNIGANSGIFKIEFSGSGVSGRCLFVASCHNGTAAGSAINQLGFTTTNGSLGLTQIRVVYNTTATANYAYVEVYNPTALAITYTVDLMDATGWSLITPSTVGSIPTGYTSESLILDTGFVSMEDITANRQLVSKIATGTAPMVVTSTTKVTNLNADKLDDQEGSYYLNWANITNKPDPVITLAGDLTGNVTLTDLGSGTLTAAVVDNSHNHLWANITDRPSSLPASGGNADTLDGYDSSAFAPISHVTDTGASHTYINQAVTTTSSPTFIDVTLDSINFGATLFETITDTLEAWTYSNKSYSVASQETSPTGSFFSADGTKMYIIGSTGDDINQYTLSTAWDVSTAVYSKLFSVAAQDTAPSGLFFKSDGTIMYVLGDAGDDVNQYTLSTPWDVGTATYSKLFSVAAQETSPSGISFSIDGTKMYVTGSSGDDVNQYTLSTAWDIATATYTKVYSVATYESAPASVCFSSDGHRMYITGSTYDSITLFTLSTAWDVGTATYTARLNISRIGDYILTSPTSVFVNETQGKAYIVGTGTDRVFQMDTTQETIKVTGNKVIYGTDVHIKDDLIVYQNLRTQGSLEITGSGSIGSSLSIGGDLTVGGGDIYTSSSATSTLFNNTTTGAVTIYGAQTTGAFILGGAVGTGAITVGRSTDNQTVNIASGATASGKTSIVNLGTSGLAGSTTNITIGTSAGTCNISILGTVTNTITASISGNSSTATKLQTARTISLTGDVSGSTTFDGSGNVSITTVIADDSHNHIISNIDNLQTTLDVKAPLDSPVLTGTPTAPTPATTTNSTQIATTAYVKNQGYITASGTVATATNADTVDGQHASAFAPIAHVTDTGSSHTYINQAVTTTSSPTFVTVTAALSGNASTATKLQTARTISLTGDVTGSVSFDGSGNVSIATTYKTSGVTAGTYKSVTVDNKGNITAGSNPTTISGYGITDAAPLSHVSSDGSSHTFINQNVTTTASPTFAGVNINSKFSIQYNSTENSLDFLYIG